jgi:hypothetical protein
MSVKVPLAALYGGKDVKIPYELFMLLSRYFLADERDGETERLIKCGLQAKGKTLIKRVEYAEKRIEEIYPQA